MERARDEHRVLFFAKRKSISCYEDIELDLTVRFHQGQWLRSPGVPLDRMWILEKTEFW
jgi:hypothetical protein